MVYSHGQGGGEGFCQCEHFADMGSGVSFSIFCADIFYGRPLTEKSFKIQDLIEYIFSKPEMALADKTNIT